MSIGLQVWSQTASANSTADTNINWAEGMAPSQVNDSARAEMASMAKWRDDNNGTLVTAGTTLAYTVTSNQVEGALTAGYTVAFQMHATNDVAATLAVDSLAAKPLQVICGTNLSGGELLVGNIYRATYSTTGTGQWIINSGDAVGAGGIGTFQIANSAVTYGKMQGTGASLLLGNPSTSTSTGVQEITLGTNLSFSGTVLNSGNNTPALTIITSTATVTWQSTTKGGNFPLYLAVRMASSGGGGGASNTGNGTAGTTTIFNNWTAEAGRGGAGGGNGTGGAGGTGGTDGTGTKIRRIPGGTGLTGNYGAQGGGSAIAPATVNPTNPNSNATINAVANTGTGGAGGLAPTGSYGGGGGGGEYVEFIITTPSTAYTVQVGAGGPGGATSGTTGGAGGSGRIEVIAYWQ